MGTVLGLSKPKITSLCYSDMTPKIREEESLPMTSESACKAAKSQAIKFGILPDLTVAGD